MVQPHSTHSRFAQATIIGDSDSSTENLDLAGRVGAMLARHAITVVTGARGGVMEAATQAAVQAGGTALGILPSTRMDDANPWCSIVIPTGLGHARNVITALAADVVIAIGGGAGTLSEICFSWIHGRPIFLMEGSGGWSDRLAGEAIDQRATSVIIRCSSVATLEKHVIEFCRARGLSFRSA